ncbi:MAG: DUF1553 domain-containing protein [Verrucomicrobiae bacterium]|nr:DUF1553 domain-containing protein [Verrucomicrobiae bacterium]
MTSTLAGMVMMAMILGNVGHSLAVDFQADILPILEARCLDCHGADKQKSQLRLDTMTSALRGGDSGEKAIVPGDSAASHLIALVTSEDPEHRMPPKGEPLSAAQTAALKAWIDDAAPWQPAVAELSTFTTDHWSFQPIQRPPIPASEFAHPIDAFVAEKLKANGLDFNPESDRRSLVRRMFLDMTGLLPTPEELAQFAEADPADLADHLLASPHYGERWARHWLDVVRFAESAGFETNHERPTAYHYRDYVIRALNDDKPYDRFVFEQIAGDTVGQDAATGFIVGGAWDRVKGKDPVLGKMQRQDELSDMVNTTGTAFLGLTMGCAKCHNHKFDPITQTDFFAMQSVFTGVEHGERELKGTNSEERKAAAEAVGLELEELRRELGEMPIREPVTAASNTEIFDPISARLVRFTIEATQGDSQPCIDELEIWSAAGSDRKNVALSGKATSSSNLGSNPKHKLEHLNDGKFGNSFSWISGEKGKGWVQIELPESTQISEITWARDREKKYADRLAMRYRIEVGETPEKWTLVASSDTRLPFGSDLSKADLSVEGIPQETIQAAQKLWSQIRPLEEHRAELLKQPMVYAGKLRQPSEPTRRLFRGDPLAPKEVVAPEGLTVLIDRLGSFGLAPDAPEQQRRVALANWIIHPDNPLTARVIANRIWHYHFGKGLVATPSDFGDMGFRPTHPELLDWLASELMENGWSLKHLHRLILTSRVYQQSSAPRADGLAKDAAAQWLWRFPPRRVEAEVIRDNILLVSGNLDPTMNGPGFLLFEPNANYSRNWVPKQNFEPTDMRRMIYALKLRMEQDAVFGAFDCPDAGSVTPARSRSTTPIQALNLYNSDFVLDQAHRFADRARKATGSENVSAQVDAVFQLALGRSPSAEESADADYLAETHGLEALCRAIFNANEFLFLP